MICHLLLSLVIAGAGARRAVPTPPEAFTPMAPHASVSPVLYLNRCSGGCTILSGGVNDARNNTSTIPSGGDGTYTIGEYAEVGQTGAAADAAWNELVQCVKEVYSPYRVQVVDQRPTEGAYHMAIVAGLPEQIGLPAQVQGIAPASPSCTPQDNVISFSFANAHPSSGHERALNLCWTVSQEAAHAFGIPNHSWAFTDGRSACNDPMTYRTDCGGEKFFRNADAVCGEFAEAESCACGPTHNTHQKLTSVFGAQEPITAAPTSMITLPIAGGALGAVVGVQAGSQRGVAKVELLVNGFEWAEVKGGPYGVNGQANPGTYTILVPTNLPDGVVDLVARACDDIGACTESAVVTATKGVPCTSADTCAQGQHCDAGKCLWDPGSGQVGDGCAFDPMCASGMCSPTVDDRICTQTCGAEAACPEGLACLDTQAGSFCYFPQDAGCCSAGTGASAGYAQLGLGALVIGLVARRRRRR